MFKGVLEKCIELHIVKRLRPPKSSSHLEKRAPIYSTQTRLNQLREERSENSTIFDDKSLGKVSRVEAAILSHGKGRLFPSITIAGTFIIQ